MFSVTLVHAHLSLIYPLDSFNITNTNFQNYNENPSVPCPSLVVGSAVCVQVFNATDTIPPTPTNAAAGSAPSVRVHMPWMHGNTF